MGLKPAFSMTSVEKYVKQRVSAIDQAIFYRLSYMGEKCLAECRTNKTYMDQRGNLTSSMGYVIIAEGKIKSEVGFDKNLEADKGMDIGSRLAKKLAREVRTGFALIVVAGMDYAAYVEAKGKNVLSSAELLAERELPGMLRQLTRNIKKQK